MENDLKHYEITRSVIGSFYQVYKELGHGFCALHTGLNEIELGQ